MFQPAICSLPEWSGALLRFLPVCTNRAQSPAVPPLLLWAPSVENVHMPAPQCFSSCSAAVSPLVAPQLCCTSCTVLQPTIPSFLVAPQKHRTSIKQGFQQVQRSVSSRLQPSCFASKAAPGYTAALHQAGKYPTGNSHVPLIATNRMRLWQEGSRRRFPCRRGRGTSPHGPFV